MQQAFRKIKRTTAAVLLMSMGILPAAEGIGRAAFGDDLEKPRPEFSTQDQGVAAKLVPRGKSTSVHIQFDVAGGRLAEVEAADLDEASHKEVDLKDFRSGLFAVRIEGLAPGGGAELSLSSNYFTGATELWAFNREKGQALTNSQARNLDRPERVQTLVVTLSDGGRFDSDGAADGRILFIAGPRDSFWGYALGTLLIRFFGIFIVLGVLQAGMLLTGAIFQRLERRAGRRKPESIRVPAAAEEEGALPETIEPETAAAIGLALHLHLSALRAAAEISLEQSEGSSWARQGRSQIMRDRLLVHDRTGRK